MTNGHTSTIIALLLLFSVLSAAQVAMIISMTQPQAQQQPQPAREQAVSIALMWRTPMTDGASPRQVLQSTAKRMQYEQSTILGSDRNAQALVRVLEAIAILEGRDTKTEDGFPIIE
jgi:Na+-translocating ferredoxin:NAD+ oxidoreductase RnfG subunit